MDFLKKDLNGFIRFAIVGSTGMIIDFSIVFFLKEVLGIDLYVSNSLSFTVSSLSNYVLNKIFTFRERLGFSYNQFLKFFLISILGLILSTISIYMMCQFLQIGIYISKLLSILIVSMWNYSANKIFTFRKVKFEEAKSSYNNVYSNH